MKYFTAEELAERLRDDAVSEVERQAAGMLEDISETLLQYRRAAHKVHSILLMYKQDHVSAEAALESIKHAVYSDCAFAAPDEDMEV